MLEKCLEPSILIGLISLVILSIEDLREGYISTHILYGLIGYGLLNKVLYMTFTKTYAIDSLVCFLLVVALLALSHFSKEHFGMGDALVLSAIGLLMGWQFLVTNMVLAFMAVGLWGLFIILSKKGHKKTLIPFVPFVTVSYMLLIWLN